MSSAGDVNGDGIADVIIGAEMGAEAYVIFGSAGAFPASVAPASLDGTNGFQIVGGNFRSVSDAGDVNGDGIDDLILANPLAPDENDLIIGKAYLVFGTDAGFPAVVDVTDLDGSNGFTFEFFGPNQTVTSASGAGDVNDDGFDDLIFGSPRHSDDGLPIEGESYIVYGGQALLDAFDFADGTQDGVIDLSHIGDDPFA